MRLVSLFLQVEGSEERDQGETFDTSTPVIHLRISRQEINESHFFKVMLFANGIDCAP